MIATYGFMLCFVFWIIVLIWLLAIFNVSWFGHSYVFFGIVMAMATPPFVVLFYLRRRDKSGTLFSEEALVRTLAALAERHKSPIISPPPLPVTPLPQDESAFPTHSSNCRIKASLFRKCSEKSQRIHGIHFACESDLPSTVWSEFY